MARSYEPHHPIIGEILLDDEGHPPCDPPDSCSVCVLFGEDTPAWRERVRQAFQNASHAFAGRARTVGGLTRADSRLLAVLTTDYQNSTQLARQLGVHPDSIVKAVSAARKRGAQIEMLRTVGYRLKMERSA